MRKLFFAGLVTIFVATTAFAEGESNISTRVVNSFRQDFSNVNGVQWSTTASYPTATFVMNNKRTSAFYNQSGELIGTSQAITIDALPASAKRAFGKKYNGYTVVEAIQFDGVEESAYFLSAKKDDTSVLLRVSNGQLSVFK
jgi:hypothetical protein